MQHAFDKAITDYSEAIRLDPNNAKFHDARGQANTLLDRIENACADLTEAVRLNAKEPKFWHNLGVIYDLKGNRRSAISHWITAIRLNPQFEASRRLVEQCLSGYYIVINPGNTPLEYTQFLTDDDVGDANEQYGEETFDVLRGEEAIKWLIEESTKLSKALE